MIFLSPPQCLISPLCRQDEVSSSFFLPLVGVETTGRAWVKSALLSNSILLPVWQVSVLGTQKSQPLFLPSAQRCSNTIPIPALAQVFSPLLSHLEWVLPERTGAPSSSLTSPGLEEQDEEDSVEWGGVGAGGGPPVLESQRFGTAQLGARSL